MVDVKERKPGFRLAFFCCCFALIVLGLGAFTRLVDAGLGCPDWPGCYGHILWPNEHHEIAAANLAYPDAPVAKDKTWPEMVHRYFAAALGVLTIALVVFAFKYRRQSQPFKLPVFILGFIVLQGLFGMWTVTLKLWPQVVTAHLLGGFTMLSLLWLLTLRLANQHWQLTTEGWYRVRALRPLAGIALLVVICQIFLGGWTTSNYADVACPDLPTCQAQWWPAMDFSEGFNIFQSIGPNYLGGNLDNEARMAIHYSHRIGALVTMMILLWLAARLYFGVREQPCRRLAVAIVVVLGAQLLLGLSNIIFRFPVAVAVAHNLVGSLLLLTMVTVNHRIYTAEKKRE